MQLDRKNDRCNFTIDADGAGRPQGLDRIEDQIVPADLLIRLDLAAVLVVNSTDLSVLVELHKQTARTGKTLILANIQPMVRKTLVITRLDQLLTLED